jgi:hypothetical protein
LGLFFYSEVYRIEKWHSEGCAEVSYQSEETEAGFPELFKVLGWRAVLYSLAGSDFEKQDRIGDQSVYKVYHYLQFLSHKTKCEKEYAEIMKRKNKL